MRLRERLRYWFDGTMDRGTPALIGWLGLASLALVTVVTTLVVLLTDEDTEAHGGWPGVVWMSVLRTLDPGTMGGDTGRPVFLGLMLTVTLGGIFIVSALIGVLTAGLNRRIERLRKGRSRLFEHGHTIVLGWSEQVFTVVAELVEANQSQRRSCVVVLADHDKVDMEDQIRARVPDTGRTRVVCRSGNPLRPADLELVSPDTSKSIMVLPPTGPEADTMVIKTLLVLNHRTWRGNRPHVVAAVQDSDNLAAARLAAGSHGLVIDADDIAVRLIVQSHRQTGLSTVCNELLSFFGNEIYIRREPSLHGFRYGDILNRYDLGVPLGLHTHDGRVLVNPAMDTVLDAADGVIVIAEDDLLVRLAHTAPPVHEEAIASLPGQPRTADRTLLIGWNSRVAKIIQLLDSFAKSGSALHIAAPRRPYGDTGPDAGPDAVPLPVPGARAGTGAGTGAGAGAGAALATAVDMGLGTGGGLAAAYENLTVSHVRCDPTSRRALEALDPGGYQHILVLSDDSSDPEQADNRTLVTLLHLRDIEERLGDPYSIVTEMNDDSNREVAQVTKADDFIVSSKLISLMLTQLTENRHLYAVMIDLFDPAGSEIYLKPADRYLLPDVEANFATVVEAARRRGESAIGYRLGSHADEPVSFGVRLNPSRTAPLRLGPADHVIVLAEEE
ncbi:CASTOR/POLLUX-related putative ion channel [Streptomyces phytohabitans]|uniref:CASTOR/POLLUX-related putative ion channel n=1 Tax=Streptomyces phytohabitans TaxID=1150371 RepID=UPI00345C1F16